MYSIKRIVEIEFSFYRTKKINKKKMHTFYQKDRSILLKYLKIDLRNEHVHCTMYILYCMKMKKKINNI